MNLHIKNIILPKGDSVEKSEIFVVDGIIADIGQTPDGFSADEVIDGKGMLALPAFVNAHTHDYMTVLRGVADDLPFMTWLFDGVMPREDKLSPDQAYWSSLLGCAEMICRGTGTFLDMHLFPGASAKAAIDSGMRACVSRGLVGSEGGQERLDAQFKEIEDFKNFENISFMLAPHAIYTCDEEYLRYVSSEAKRLGLAIHTHLAESKTEFDDCIKAHGCTPTEYLYNLGMFENKTVAAHCIQLTDRDIEILAECGVSVASNPRSNLKLGNGIAPLYKLDRAGVNVCLGTDSTASNNALNMFSELNYAALLQKGITNDPTVIPARKAFEFATVNGAKAIGIDKLGRIEKGWKADIMLLDIDKPNMVPFREVYSMICYSADGSETDTVILNGKTVYRHGEFLTIDMERVKFEVASMIEKGVI